MKKLYYGGSIITMENEQDSPEAVLVVDGRIQAVGSRSEVEEQAGESVERIDLQGQCLMPSFIDSHGHVCLNGVMAGFADLSTCETFQEIIDTLQAYIKEKKITSRGMVMARGYDHNFLEGQAHPLAEILDQASKDIPIIAMHTSGHLACANSIALKLMKITEDTPDPEGGRFGRVEGTNIPNGYMEEGAFMKSVGKLATRFRMNIFAILRNIQKDYPENGVTTAQDGATVGAFLILLKVANALNKLDIDIVSYVTMEGKKAPSLDKNLKYKNRYHKHLKLGGYKLILDGSPQGRSAWLTQPYLAEGAGEEGYCAYGTMKDEDLYRYTLQAVNEGQQVLTHCNGDAASDQWIRAYEYALEHSTNPRKMELRPVMIHCQTARKDQLEAMSKLKMIASIFVGHVYYWGDVHLKNLGEKRGHYISPVRDAMDLGVSVNFHQDTPITKPNMLHTVWCAVNRRSREGVVVGAGQAITAYEALEAVTIHAAYQYREEDSKGSIKAGKRADLVILDQNPLEVEKLKIKDIKVMETIKDGRTIYKA